MSLALIRSSPAVELNPEQQLAVEYGIGEPKGSGPLLVIAGAGSGKTSDAGASGGGAHPLEPIRSASCSPPFRAAAASLAVASNASCPPSRAWASAAAATPAYAGTFHAIGARLLREYATRLGLDPQFTIHDRADSADL